MKETLDRIDKARTELLLVREDMNAKNLYHLAGEVSVIVMVLDELHRVLLSKEYIEKKNESKLNNRG